MQFRQTLKKAIQPIATITNNQIEFLEKGVEKKVLNKGEFLNTPNSICDQLGIIASGAFHSFLNNKNRLYTCEVFIQPYFICDFNSFFSNTPSKKYIQALRKSTVYLISRTDFEAFELAFYPKNEISQYLLKQLYLEKDNHLAALLSMDAYEKYQRLRIEFPHFEQAIPDKYLASMIGIRPESLSRIRRRRL